MADGSQQAEEAAADLSFYGRLVAEHCNEAIVVTDTGGRVEWVNPAFVVTTGYSLQDMRGRKPGDVLQGPDTDTATVREIARALSARRPVHVEILNYTRHGKPYWVEMHIAPVFSEVGRHTHFIAVERDITERRALEERTREVFEAEEFQQSERRLLAEMSEWLYSAKSQAELLDVVKLAMGTLMPEAEGALYLHGAEREGMRLAVHWGGAQAPAQVRADECWALRRGRAYHYGAQAIQLPCAHAEPGDAPHFCLPIVAQSETIGLLHLSFAVFRRNGATSHEEFLRRRWTTALTCAEQISLAVANVRLRNELEERSLRDPLTRLHNRRWLLEQGEGLLRAARAAGAPFTLVALDIDHFKRVNDTFGHDVGDRVLDAVGTIIGRGVAGIGHPCRIGGEEFAVLLPRIAAPDARRTVDTLRDRLAEIAMREGGEDIPRITVSAGVAEAPRAGETLPALLKAADRALYAAKSAGRDRVMEAEALSGESAGRPSGSPPGHRAEAGTGTVTGRRWRDAPPSAEPSTDAATETTDEAADEPPQEGPDRTVAPARPGSGHQQTSADVGSE